MASSGTTRPDTKRSRARRCRSGLAALVSIALALSFLHGLNADDDDAVVTVAAAQTSCDNTGKSAPDRGAPHGDHCLAHVTTVAAQDSAVPIEYVTRLYRLAAVPMPKAADLASPFKPPRA